MNRSVLDYACPVWHSGLTAGQCNAIENIQKHAIRMIYSDTDTDYEIVLIVARMDSLKDRREMLMARFFKRQVLASNALLMMYVVGVFAYIKEKLPLSLMKISINVTRICQIQNKTSKTHLYHRYVSMQTQSQYANTESYVQSGKSKHQNNQNNRI